MCWQLYPISSPPDDLCHDLIQRESHSAQDYGWRPALMALLQELSLYYTRRHQTERLHAHKHILSQHDIFVDSPDHIIKTYSFSSAEMSYAAGVKFFKCPEIISCKTLFCVQSFLVMSCFKPVVLWVICSPVKTFIFTVFLLQYLPNLLMSSFYIFLFSF